VHVRCAGEVVAQALEVAHRHERPHLGAATADRNGGMSVGTDQRHRLELAPVEWQQLAVVLEQHHGGLGGFERELAPLLREQRHGAVELLPVEPAEADRRA
jgi:hypothetical protein